MSQFLLLSSPLLPALLTILAISLISFVYSTIQGRSTANKYAQLALKKRIQRDQQIKVNPLPKLTISTSLQEKILNSDVFTLLQMLQADEVTSEEILITYLQRASTIGLDLNLLAETNFQEALSQARECDRLRKQNPAKCQGTLFGIPISIKDCFQLKGSDTTIGMASRLFNPAQKDAFLVRLLKEEGAIIFTKSNLPQALLSLDTNNHIWGEAKNPWDRTRSTGGSSGGEAGLISARCSPLGVGNDLGGSIRFPSVACGIVGFKPTAGRVTNAGVERVSQSIDNLMVLELSTGSMAKSVRDAELFMKATLNGKLHETAKLSERDPYYVRKEWKGDLVEKTRSSRLRIGFFKSLEILPPCPASQRAIEEAVQGLKAKGHEVFEVEFPMLEDLGMMFVDAWFCEGDAQLLQELKGEKPMKHFDGMKLNAAIPDRLKGPLIWLLRYLGEGRMGKLLSHSRKLDVYELFGLADRQKKAREGFFKIWEENRLDGLLSPGFAFPALKLGFGADLGLAVLYTAPFNVLNLPAGVVPVSVVKKGEDMYPKERNDLVVKKAQESMKGSLGMPVGVQIATLPWEDEKCIGIMAEVEDAVRFREKHSCVI